MNKKQTRFLNCPIRTLSDSSPRTPWKEKVEDFMVQSPYPMTDPWDERYSPLPIYEWLIFCGILVGQIHTTICKPKAASILTTTALSPYQSSYFQHLPTKQKQPMICFILLAGFAMPVLLNHRIQLVDYHHVKIFNLLKKVL